MRKRSRIALALLLLAVIGGIAWLTLRPNEPTYKGKQLSVWLKVYTDRDSDAPKIEAANEAVRHIGTNAIPTLLRRLRAEDSPLKMRLADLASKQHVLKVHFEWSWDLNWEAVRGFRALGAEAKDAVPELIRMYEQDRSLDSQEFAAMALGHIGPAAEKAVPALVRVLGDKRPGSGFPFCTLSAIGYIHAHPKIAVPALVKCLGDQDSGVRQHAAEAIGNFGDNARQSVPALTKLLNDSHQYVRENAQVALKKIDPEAAAKAGVK